MSIDSVTSLRPANETADEHRRALYDLRHAIDVTTARIDGLLQQRADVLLSGSISDVKAAEGELAHARLELEQMTALADHIEVGIPALSRAESNAALAASLRTFDDRLTKIRKAILEEYPALAKRIAEICGEMHKYSTDFVSLHRAFGNYQEHPRFDYVTSRDAQNIPRPLYALVNLPDVRDVVGLRGDLYLTPLWTPKDDVSGHSDGASQAEIMARSARERR